MERLKKLLKDRKAISIGIIVVVIVSLFFVFSNKKQTIEMKASTGDTLQVSLKSNDYKLVDEKNDIFSIKKGDKVISQGVFVSEKTAIMYKDTLQKNKMITNKKEGNKNGSSFIYFESKTKAGNEYTYVTAINKSETGYILSNNVDSQSAQEIFDDLSITKK